MCRRRNAINALKINYLSQSRGNGIDLSPTMDETTRNLVALQALELEAKATAKRLTELPTEVLKAERELAAAQKLLATVEQNLVQEAEGRQKLETAAESFRQKAKRLEAQLDSVQNQAQATALSREQDFARNEMNRLDEEQLASLEKSEQLDATLLVARDSAEQKSLILERTRVRIKSLTEEATLQGRELAAKRVQLREAIPEEILTTFDRLAASRGTGLARAENQLCRGCLMGIRLPLWSRLRDGELLKCDNCGRLLYWDPDLRLILEARGGNS